MPAPTPPAPAIPEPPRTEAAIASAPPASVPRAAAPEEKREEPRAEQAGTRRGTDAPVPGVDQDAKRPPVRDTGSTQAVAEPLKPAQTVLPLEPPAGPTPVQIVPASPPEPPPAPRTARTDAPASAPIVDPVPRPALAAPAITPVVPEAVAPIEPRQAAEAQPSGPPLATPAPPERRGTAGLGLVRLRLQVDGPSERTTSVP